MLDCLVVRDRNATAVWASSPEQKVRVYQHQATNRPAADECLSCIDRSTQGISVSSTIGYDKVLDSDKVRQVALCRGKVMAMNSIAA